MENTVSLNLSEKFGHYEKIFLEALGDAYTSIIKVELNAGKVTELQIEGNHFVEKTIEITWDKYYQNFVEAIHPDDRMEVIMKTHPDSLLKLSDGEKIVFTYRSKMEGNDYRWYISTLRKLIVEEKEPWIILFTNDITEETTERARLKDINEHDGLTDLFNETKLDIMLDTEYKELTSCGVLYFDINDLKIVNDTMGYSIGNEFICQAAESIRSITNRRVHAYRMGGDEFVVVACNCDRAYIDDLIYMWRRRFTTLTTRGGYPCDVAVGTSWSMCPLSVKELIRIAEAEMFEFKRKMKNKN